MAEPRPAVGELTDWNLAEGDKPFVTKFPEGHRVTVPNKPFVVLSRELQRASGTEIVGKDMVVSFSTPCNGLFHHALDMDKASLVGSVILPEVKLDGYCTKPALGNRSCFVFLCKDLLLVLCQYTISEPRVKTWFDVVLSTFQPKSLHVIEDVPVSNLAARERCGEGVQVATSEPSPLLTDSAAIWPGLVREMCSQVFSEMPSILTGSSVAESGYHPVAVIHNWEDQVTSTVLKEISAALKPLLERALSGRATTLHKCIEGLCKDFSETEKKLNSIHSSIYV